MKNPAKMLILLMCFLAVSSNTIANDTIRMTNILAGYYSMSVIATLDKQFTVDWGDGSPVKTYTGKGPSTTSLSHDYSFTPGRYKVTIAASSEDCRFTFFGGSRIDTLDLSACPSIERLSYSNWLAILQSLNVRNCVNLYDIHVNGNKLTYLDLMDNIALRGLTCKDNQLARIDLVALESTSTGGNHLTLSNLYKISELVSDPYYKILGKQTLPQQRVAMGVPVDLSDQKEFGGIATVFYVERSGPAPPSDYTLDNGFLTFHRAGYYSVTMTNAAVVSHPLHGIPHVIATFNVINFVAVTEIKNVPTTATAGTPLNISNTIVPGNATYQSISWSVSDTGTTGATISGRQLNTTAPGTVVITATIKDGAALDSAYTQNFTIEVEPMGIKEPIQEISNIKVYPNPTTGILEIESGDFIIHKIEILDIAGRVVAARPFNILSARYIMDISHLKTGAYFVKIITKEGEIVKKVIKQ